MSKSNPKFWALIGLFVGATLASGGADQSNRDILVGGLMQAVLWYVISYLIIRLKGKKIIKNSGEKRKIQIFSMLDQPIAKDWILYFWIVTVIVTIPVTLGSEGAGGVSGLFDFIIGIAIQYFFFLRVPVFIRNKIRNR